MEDGQYIYYVIQHRERAKSPWLNKKPIRPVKKKDTWSFTSFDYFGHSLNPRVGTGNNWRPVSKKASSEIHAVWSKTGSEGWWNLIHAVKALKRLKKDDVRGKYDARDGYSNHEQCIRHEFRIVKMTVSQKTDIVNMEDLIKAIA